MTCAGMMSRTAMNMLSGFIIMWLGLMSAAEAKEKDGKLPMPDLTKGGHRDAEHDWTLGPTGARGWMYGCAGRTAEARQILVTAVAKGSPADGILQNGDVIVGVGDQPFADDARIHLANAITAAELEQGGGVLRLIRWRGGATEKVELKLAVMGAYSATAPYGCKKSQTIFARGCQVIAKHGLGNVSIPNDLNALALLASGSATYRPMLAEYASKVAAYKTDSMATWLYGYANMFLAEYVMATGDTSVLPGLKRIALEAALGQTGVGTWGHKFVTRADGNLDGYGCMNQPGLSLTISMVLARQAGVNDPALDRAIAKAAGFLHWYTFKGAIPYGDHAPWNSHEDNGKCSSAAVLFDLLDDREAATFFAKMATAAYSERERGHTGNFFNVLWALPGVSRCGPLATGAYVKEQAWYYDLARGWEGGFGYQGNPPGAEEHGKYTDWDCTGAYLLAYALPLKSLHLTGKRPCSVPALNAKEVEEVIVAGRDFFSGYDERKTEELLSGLLSWSPAVRLRSAKALGQREGDFVPGLLKVLAGSDRDARYGACEALSCLGHKADAAAPQLRAVLAESDPWMQSLACKALMNLGEEARTASVNDLLAMVVRPNPADPRRMNQRAACVALFDHAPGTRTPTILNGSLEGVDRSLLLPAMRSVLQNEDSVVRGSLGNLYAKLSDGDLAALLPDIIRATEKLAPSDEMFGDGIRLAGLDLLSRLRIREGMPLCVTVLEVGRWGLGHRLAKTMEYLLRYGANAKEVLPQLQDMRRTIDKDSDKTKILDEAIAKIASSTLSPTLVTLKEFMAHPTSVPKNVR